MRRKIKRRAMPPDLRAKETKNYLVPIVKGTQKETFLWKAEKL